MASPLRRLTLFDLAKDKKLKKKDNPALGIGRSNWIYLLAAFILFRVVRWTFFPWPTYESRAQRDFRSFRFPSIHDRARLYMGEWYLNPCNGSELVQILLSDANSGTMHLRELTPLETSSIRSFSVRPQVEVSTLFYFNMESLTSCSQRKWPIGPYCSESLETIREAVTNIDAWDNRIPILLQFGDEAYTRAYNAKGDELLYKPVLPHIKKFRMSKPKKDARLQLVERTRPQCNGMRSNSIQPIIWKLNAKRHYRDLYLVPRSDRKWKQKLDKAVFRGAATGNGLQNYTVACLELPRCQLVYKYANSQIVDAKLTKLLGKLPPVIDGIEVASRELSLRDMLRYKAIIILEGNDVSSGLKWALLSQSVVLMPQPKFTSWAMEELLEPWVHYIPLKSDLSDVEELVQWMLQHQTEAQRISHRASLWIKDLVFHSDSESDDRMIYQEILKRYAAYFKV